ncbi:helix-turn-helix domain-containing protein [Labilibacter marinus]|uniref:helix-turn-helix domain-containing protein n=1 Tax=Labilibacter marinus TaxID=1477105 RepID=UPI00094F9632|nr:helix-turn-helix domain-containing protein [Labilibacter marinus]
MSVNFNSNIKLLNGGAYCGASDWNKSANDIDNCFKLYFLRSGKVEFYSNNKVYTIEGPNLYLINGYAISSQKCIDKFVVDWLHFIPESVYFNHLLRSTSCVTILNINEFTSFQPLFKKYNPYFLCRMSNDQERITKLEIQSFLQFALAKVFYSIDTKLFETNNTILRLLPALEYIAQNYTSEIRLSKLAEICFLSPNYFHRLFTKNFEVSPLVYIRQMRLEEAIRQLVYTTKNVKEIAFFLGYEDEAYFSRTFSNVYKISPGRYRKENRKKLP